MEYKTNSTQSTYWVGYLMGLLSSATFGLIPLLSIPVLNQGVSVSTVLMYRFLFATIIVGGITLLRRERLGISLRTLLSLMALSVLYFFSALLLLEGYNYMPSGIATVLHFSYPTFVVVLMFLLFRQRIRWLQGFAVLLALVGVSLISGVLETEVHSIPIGPLVTVLISGLSYATYIIILNKAGIEPMSSFKLTTYVMGFSTILFAIYGSISEGIMPILAHSQWLYVFLLALIPTVCANVSLVWAVQRIGSTPTAIMGALEPLTAVIVGSVAFGEKLSLGQSVGIAVVLLAVLLLVLAPFIPHTINKRSKY